MSLDLPSLDQREAAMDASLQRRIQRYGWDRAAGHYDDGWTRQLAPGQDLMLDMAGIMPGARVIDIAAGTRSQEGNRCRIFLRLSIYTHRDFRLIHSKQTLFPNGT